MSIARLHFIYISTLNCECAQMLLTSIKILNLSLNASGAVTGGQLFHLRDGDHVVISLHRVL